MRPLRLRWLRGPLAGGALEVSAKRLRIGRSRDNDVVLPDLDPPVASGRHAEIWREGASWWIADLGSTNGTFVNGQRIERQRLQDGDRIGFGGEPDVACEAAAAAASRWAKGALLAAVAAIAVALGMWLVRRPPSLEGAAEEVASALWLVAIERDAGREAVGSAFAIRRDGWLATNAHVAAEIERQGLVPPGAGARALAVLNDSPGTARPIVEVRLHPGYRPGSFRDDVALLVLAPGEPIPALERASREDLARLRRGVRAASFGFPGGGTDPLKPRGRLREHVLGDVRGGYLEIGLGVAPGISGSPLFTADGKVVGLVVGGDIGPGASGSGLSWAIAVTALDDLVTASGPARAAP